MRILYLHDFGKDSNQALLTSLKSDFEVIAPLMKPEEITNEAFIERIIADQLGDKFIVVGEGLGAYWTNHFASKLELFSVLINPCFNPQVDYNIQAEPITGLGHSTQTYVLIDRANKATSVDKVDTLFDHKAYVEAYGDQKELISILNNKALKELSYHARTYQTCYGFNMLNFHKDMEAWDRDRVTLPHLVRQILEDENPLKDEPDSVKREEIYDCIANEVNFYTKAKWLPLHTRLNKIFSFFLGYKLEESVIDSLACRLLNETPRAEEYESYVEEYKGNHRFYDGPIKQLKTMDSSFEFSPQQIADLEKLNTRLIAYESEILEEAINMELKIKQHAADTQKTISNYCLTVEISVRMATEGEEQNDWLFFTEELASGCSENKEAFLERINIDHNSLPADHPLSAFHHSWLFHQLYAVQRVSFTDMLKINNVHGTAKARFRAPFLDFA